MSEPKPQYIPCKECDHLCDQTDDGECMGRMTKEERQAVIENIAWAYLNNAKTVIANPIDFQQLTQ